MEDHRELGRFLRTRRARVSPESAGLRGGARRRVPGLRREELAQLAGISAEYYQRLEQGRATRPSDEVLDSLAEVLRLDAVEREHLRVLARPARRRTGHVAPVEIVRPELRRLLGLINVPAIVINDRFDLLAGNPGAKQIFALDTFPAARGNLARFQFLVPEGRVFYVEWEEVAAATVGELRVAAGRYPGDAELSALIRELHSGSGDFRRLWAGGDVDVRTYGVKRFHHGVLGTLTFCFENFELAGDARQRLITFTPVGSGEAEVAPSSRP
ncbi:helix-turn-helix transcriptional regulator [Actinoallomurus rhizosphaericola]|uniref:helix-turn-helix transcriptional regulator n=1 Tax=Actinoallomurus rhizosphaericola TaxID=2952536 RepID=UPI002092A5E9|nr:helix-turn-helix transcriptional regulator [Actinoallomurus rhizosphaericola]MCO5996760.1 helix-turn-helix transcriptional regulator [Actinoallomurus rhizosphaericola]